ncbi:unnamed protein product [Linum trigynum]|uniref:Uncharacterized protein n=1 Tax=Linum trigynum TaxID=586398 RepID=A0AAV2DXS8_9ROSI
MHGRTRMDPNRNASLRTGKGSWAVGLGRGRARPPGGDDGPPGYEHYPEDDGYGWVQSREMTDEHYPKDDGTPGYEHYPEDDGYGYSQVRRLKPLS